MLKKKCDECSKTAWFWQGGWHHETQAEADARQAHLEASSAIYALALAKTRQKGVSTTASRYLYCPDCAQKRKPLSQAAASGPPVREAGDPTEMLLSLKRKIEALGGASIGPGEINPGLSMNIDQAVQALRTGKDPAGKTITKARVADGLKRLAAHVNTPEWYLVAGGTIRNGSVDMLKSYVYDLQVIAGMI